MKYIIFMDGKTQYCQDVNSKFIYRFKIIPNKIAADNIYNKTRWRGMVDTEMCSPMKDLIPSFRKLSATSDLPQLQRAALLGIMAFTGQPTSNEWTKWGRNWWPFGSKCGTILIGSICSWPPCSRPLDILLLPSAAASHSFYLRYFLINILPSKLHPVVLLATPAWDIRCLYDLQNIRKWEKPPALIIFAHLGGKAEGNNAVFDWPEKRAPKLLVKFLLKSPMGQVSTHGNNLSLWEGFCPL